MQPSVIALDIDLRRIHAWSTKLGRVCYKSPELPDCSGHDVVLAECWSPHFYMKEEDTLAKKKGEITNRFRAAIYNSMQIGILADRYPNLLIAPSSDWTLKYKEEIRHIMAGVQGQDNHDIRECRAMVWFYRNHPKTWKTFREYVSCL